MYFKNILISRFLRIVKNTKDHLTILFRLFRLDLNTDTLVGSFDLRCNLSIINFVIFVTIIGFFNPQKLIRCPYIYV